MQYALLLHNPEDDIADQASARSAPASQRSWPPPAAPRPPSAPEGK